MDSTQYGSSWPAAPGDHWLLPGSRTQRRRFGLELEGATACSVPIRAAQDFTLRGSSAAVGAVHDAASMRFVGRLPPHSCLMTIFGLFWGCLLLSLKLAFRIYLLHRSIDHLGGLDNRVFLHYYRNRLR
jgi:hypothetical protein